MGSCNGGAKKYKPCKMAPKPRTGEQLVCAAFEARQARYFPNLPKVLRETRERIDRARMWPVQSQQQDLADLGNRLVAYSNLH
jgi:hypothetical protein